MLTTFRSRLQITSMTSILLLIWYTKMFHQFLNGLKIMACNWMLRKLKLWKFVKNLLCQLEDFPKIVVDKTVIEFSKVVKNLGLFIDQHMDLQAHIISICRTVYGGLHILNRLRASRPLNVRKKLFNALLRPHFMYCYIIFSATSATILLRLQQAFNSCIRYVLDLKNMITFHKTPHICWDVV